MDELQSLRTVDPVHNDRLLRKCASPLFEELFVQLVSLEVDDIRPTPGPRGRSGPGRSPSSHRHRRPVIVGAVLAAAAVAVLFAVVLPNVNRAVPVPRWALVGDVSPAWQEIPSHGLASSVSLSLTCPSATTCYATDFLDLEVTRGRALTSLGGGVEVTRDAGKTWADVVGAPKRPLAGLSRVTCVSASTCAVLVGSPSKGPLFMQTTDAGRTWVTRPAPSELSSLYQATGSTGSVVTVEGGVGLSCSTATTCSVVATDVGSRPALAFATSNGGRTWSASTLSLPWGGPGTDLRCFSSGRCILAAQSGGAYSTNGGRTWSSGAGYLGAVALELPFLSCSNASDCMVTNPTGLPASWVGMTSDGGRHWSAVNAKGLPAGWVYGLSCPTSSDCWALAGPGPALGPGPGDVVVSTTNAGETWQRDALPRGLDDALGLSCPSSNTCFALAWSQESLALLAYEA